LSGDEKLERKREEEKGKAMVDALLADETPEQSRRETKKEQEADADALSGDEMSLLGQKHDEQVLVNPLYGDGDNEEVKKKEEAASVGNSAAKTNDVSEATMRENVFETLPDEGDDAKKDTSTQFVQIPAPREEEVKDEELVKSGKDTRTVKPLPEALIKRPPPIYVPRTEDQALSSSSGLPLKKQQPVFNDVTKHSSDPSQSEGPSPFDVGAPSSEQSHKHSVLSDAASTVSSSPDTDPGGGEYKNGGLEEREDGKKHVGNTASGTRTQKTKGGRTESDTTYAFSKKLLPKADIIEAKRAAKNADRHRRMGEDKKEKESFIMNKDKARIVTETAHSKKLEDFPAGTKSTQNVQESQHRFFANFDEFKNKATYRALNPQFDGKTFLRRKLCFSVGDLSVARLIVGFKAWLKAPKRPELGALAISVVALPYFWLAALSIDKNDWKIFFLATAKFCPMAIASCWISHKTDSYSQGVSLSLYLFAFRDFLSVLMVPPTPLHLMGCLAMLVLASTSSSQVTSGVDMRQKNLSVLILLIGLWVRLENAEMTDFSLDRTMEMTRILMCVVTSFINLRSANALGLVLLTCGEMQCLAGDSMKLTWAGLLWLMEATPEDDVRDNNENERKHQALR